MNAEIAMFAWSFFGIVAFALRIAMREEFMRRERLLLPDDSNLKLLAWIIIGGPLVWFVVFMFWVMGTSGCRRG